MPLTRPLTPDARRVALAACAFAATPVDAGAGRVLLQLTPAQDFTPVDGRAMDVPAWRISAAIAQRVIAAFSAAQPPVIDYEHQTLHKEANGQPAPAAGWMHGLRWIDGRGLFAVAELTERARALVQAGEYRYFSPVFEYARGSGEVTRILMGALTNHPAIAGMQALDAAQAAASARFGAMAGGADPFFDDDEDPPMNELLEKLLAALGLPADAGEEQAFAALKTLADQASEARAPAAAPAEPGVAAATAVPDPAQYVPIAVVQQLQASVAALTAQERQREVDTLVQAALGDGRLLAAQEPWARDLGAANLPALAQFVASATPIAALTSTQTGGQPPSAGAGCPYGLSADELAVATACGMTAQAYATGRLGA